MLTVQALFDLSQVSPWRWLCTLPQRLTHRATMAHLYRASCDELAGFGKRDLSDIVVGDVPCRKTVLRNAKGRKVPGHGSSSAIVETTMDNLLEETPSETRRPFQSMLDLPRHPLILLLTTALISGLMVPYIASGWQDQREQREFKAALVAEMSRSVSEIIVATQFAFLGAESQSQADFDQAYRKWEVDRIVNGVKILGVTRNSTLAADWEMLAERVTTFYAVLGYNDPERSLVDLRSLAQAPPRSECTVLPISDRQEPSSVAIDSSRDAWSAARASVLTDLGSLIGCVLE